MKAKDRMCLYVASGSMPATLRGAAAKESGFPEIWVLVGRRRCGRRGLPSMCVGGRDTVRKGRADVLASRGIELTGEMTKNRELCSAIPGAVVVAAALACTDEADFRRRIREQLDPRAELRC